MTLMKNKFLLGRTDYADFPELGLENIAVKIDSGAYTSSIHCHQIEEIITENSRTIKFNLLDPSHGNYNDKEFTFSNYKKKSIKSSNGQYEFRFVIKTKIILFNIEYPIELSLTERGEMKYPVLLGRKLLNGKFTIDTAKYNLSAKHKKLNK